MKRNVMFVLVTISLIFGSFIVMQTEQGDDNASEIFPYYEYRFVFNNSIVEISPSYITESAQIDNFNHPGFNFVGEGWREDGRKISSAGNEVCAVIQSFFLYCISSTSAGYLEKVTSSREIFGNASSGISEISIGNRHGCALGVVDNNSGNLVCWGDNDRGQLGRFSKDSVVGFSDVSRWTHITLGQSHTCAIADETDVYCWGDNSLNQIGIDQGLSSNIPILIKKYTEGVEDIESGYHHTCVRLTTNDVECWGWNSHGQAGIQTQSGNSLNLIQRNWGEDAELMANGNTTCMVDSLRGRMACWGKDIFNGLENGIISETLDSEIFIVDDSAISMFSFTGDSFCLGGLSGQIDCYNISGTKINREHLSSVPYKKIIAINSGYCGLTEDNKLECNVFRNSDQINPFSYNNLEVTSGINTNAIIGHVNTSYRSSHTFFSHNYSISDIVVIDVELSKDSDGDGWPDYLEDECNTGVFNADRVPLDTDRDGICNPNDDDDDGDGIPDPRDKFPLDRTEWRDDDGDGIGKNSDDFEISPGLVSAVLTATILSVLALFEARRK